MIDDAADELINIVLDKSGEVTIVDPGELGSTARSRCACASEDPPGTAVAETRRPREPDVDAWHADLGCWTREAALRDLLLTRVAVAVASHPQLRDELLLRGGLALHRLVLPAPLRACVDLEYARRSASGIGAVLDALREAAGEVGLAVRTEVRPLPRAYLTPIWPGTPGRLRLHVDLETRETQPSLPPVRRQLTTSGDADGPTVLTYDTVELVGLLFRELYQRSRSRDLFDLWVALDRCEVDDTAVLAAFHHACRLAGLGRIHRACSSRGCTAISRDRRSLVTSRTSSVPAPATSSRPRLRPWSPVGSWTGCPAEAGRAPRDAPRGGAHAGWGLGAGLGRRRRRGTRRPLRRGTPPRRDGAARSG